MKKHFIKDTLIKEKLIKDKFIKDKFHIIKSKKEKKESDILFVILAFGAFILIFFWNIFFGFGFLDRQRDTALEKNYQKKTVQKESKTEAKSEVGDEEKNIVKDPFITKNKNIVEDILVKPFLNKDDPILGREAADLLIVEFSDFTCSFCKDQEDVIRRVLEKYKNKVALVWKNYPDASGISLQAAVAGHCAYRQGKFWEYHDLLFKENDDLNLKVFLKLAEKLDLDTDAFNTCIYREASFQKILEDIREANALQISGVPFFFIGDQEILGSINEKDLEKIIEIELNKQ